MDRSVRKRRIGIIALWLVWAILMSVVFYAIEDRIVRDEARKEILDQANTIAGQLPALGENHFYAKVGATKAQFNKLKALSLGLEEKADVDAARELLDEFARINKAEELVMYDREGHVLYRTGESKQLDLTEETIQKLLSLDAFETMDERLVWNDRYRDIMFSSAFVNSELQNVFAWNAHQGEWTLVVRDTPSDVEKEAAEYFDWRTVLRKITIGKNGCLLALDASDGAILSWRDREMEGQPFESLGIRINGNNVPAGTEELRNAFTGEDRTAEIRIGDETYLAALVDEPYLVALELVPTGEIHGKAVSAAGTLTLLMLFITGICAGYAFFHIKDKEETVWKKRKGFDWDRDLASKLKVITVIAMALVFLGGLYLEALGVYASTFSYSREKVSQVVDLLEKNKATVDKLQQWYDEEYVTRCKLVRSILEHTEQEKITREFLDELCECLEIHTISVYDARGRRTVTNSLRKQTAIPDKSPAAVLLEGSEAFVGTREKDEVSGETLQTIGVPLWNPDETVGGMILIEVDSKEMETIRANLGFESVFEQISLTDGTFVLVIDDQDMTVKYVGEVENGIFKNSLNGYDYTGLRASDMGINESLLLDHYNGEMFVLKNRYFASARRVGEYYFLVMRPPVTVAENHMTPILVAVAGTLVYMCLLFLIATLGRKAEENPAEKSVEVPAEEKPGIDGEEEKKHRDDDVLVMLNSIVNKKKPYFEERWPEDSIRWKDRMPYEKFMVFLKVTIIFALFAILLHALISGENSVWYYCISGEWNSGINLYSITTCVIDIALLMVIKMVLHKLLYWIARAVRAKGETICHLLNSFSSYVLAITGIFLCLSDFGVDLTTLSLTGGVLGVIFGIGCQHIVADILAGILMTFEGVVHVGDFVSYNGQYGIILSIGVRTTQLLWFSEVTVIRNNDFKNYINMPSEKTDRVTTTLTVALSESIERIESILEEELPRIHNKLCEISGTDVGGPKYRGISKITETGVVLSFSIYCKGMYYGWLQRQLNRELKAMCERRRITIGMFQMFPQETEETENK